MFLTAILYITTRKKNMKIIESSELIYVNGEPQVNIVVNPAISIQSTELYQRFKTTLELLWDAEEKKDKALRKIYTKEVQQRSEEMDNHRRHYWNILQIEIFDIINKYEESAGVSISTQSVFNSF